jgi:hypothetical protein
LGFNAKRVQYLKNLIQHRPYVLENEFLSQEYALFCLGQFVSQSYGEQVFNEAQFSHRSIGTALEGAKSNALMRCCKDLGIASELWDPNYIIEWSKKHAVKVWCEHQVNKNKKLLTRRRDRPAFEYPWKEVGFEKEKVLKPVFEDDVIDNFLNDDVEEIIPVKEETSQVVEKMEVSNPLEFVKNEIRNEDDVNMFESIDFMNPSNPTSSNTSSQESKPQSTTGFNINGTMV